MSRSASRPAVQGVGLMPPSHLSPIKHYSPISLANVYHTLSTPAVGTGIALVGAGLYLVNLYLASTQYQPRSGPGFQINPSQRPRRAIPFKWLEYPAGYVPPKMNLFSDENSPLGFSSHPSCLAGSERLERSFDILRYWHAFKQLGVPSVVNRGIHMASQPSSSVSARSTSIHPALIPSPGEAVSIGRGQHPTRNRRLFGLVAGGSGFRGNPRRSLLPVNRVPAKRISKLSMSAPSPSSDPPAPPPPPPPGTSVEGDDDDSSPYSHNWGITWSLLALGTFGLLVHHRKRFFRKFIRTAPPSVDLTRLPRDEVDYEDRHVQLEFDSDRATFAGSVDEVFPKHLDALHLQPNQRPVQELFFFIIKSLSDALFALSGSIVFVTTVQIARRCFAFVRHIFWTIPATVEETSQIVPPMHDTIIVDQEVDVESTMQLEVERCDAETQLILPILDEIRGESVEPHSVVETAHVEKPSSPESDSSLDCDSDNGSLSTVETTSVEMIAPDYGSCFEDVPISNESDCSSVGPLTLTEMTSVDETVLESGVSSNDAFDESCDDIYSPVRESFQDFDDASSACVVPLPMGSECTSDGVPNSDEYVSSLAVETTHVVAVAPESGPTTNQESMPPNLSSSSPAVRNGGTPVMIETLRELRETRNTLNIIIEAQIKRATESRSLNDSMWATPSSPTATSSSLTRRYGSSSSKSSRRDNSRPSNSNHRPSATVNQSGNITLPDTVEPFNPEKKVPVPGRRRRCRPRAKGRSDGKGKSSSALSEDEEAWDVGVPDWANA